VHDPIPEPAAEALPPLPQRQRWTCTRAQLEDALAAAWARQGRAWPAGAREAAADLARAALGDLPLLGADLIVLPAQDVRFLLAAAHDFIDAALFNRCAGAAGLVSHEHAAGCSLEETAHD